MANPDIVQSWQSSMFAEAQQRQAEAASIEIQRQNRARVPGLVATADELIERIGKNEEKSYLGLTYFRERSQLCPVGDLGVADESGRSRGFAEVLVVRDSVQKTVTTGRFLLKRTSLVREPSDKVNAIHVLLYAGQEDGSDLRLFETDSWSITQGYADTENFDLLEVRLAFVKSVLDERTEGVSLGKEDK